VCSVAAPAERVDDRGGVGGRGIYFDLVEGSAAAVWRVRRSNGCMYRVAISDYLLTGNEIGIDF
jgi:hypothetical protein